MVQALDIAATLQDFEAKLHVGHYAAARDSLNHAAQMAPLDPRVPYAMALLERAEQHPAEEITALKESVRLAPRWLAAHAELSKAMSRSGNHADALAAIRAALALAPDNLGLLEIAVAIANTAGDFASAQRYLESAAAQRPDDIGIARSLGLCLAHQGLHEKALGQWQRIVAVTPDDPIAIGNIGLSLLGMGRREEAREVFERAVEMAPEDATLRFHLALARGESPPSQPRQMMEDLFDEYAARFDGHLVGKLKYRVPKRVVEIISARPHFEKSDVLDLGCGTGLLGVYLGRIEGRFIGVDIAARMLEQAARHNIYSELRQDDVLEALRKSATESFDVVTANDVFVYVGDVSDVIPEAFRVLRAGGQLIFSCETAQEAEGAFVLRPSRRYAHSPDAMRALCNDAGFTHCAIESVELRMDGGEIPIPGFIAVAQKN